MSTRLLPDSPNLRHLRNEAKALRRSVLNGATEALALVRQYLPHLEGRSDQKVAAEGLSLQKVQHVLAQSYGFDDWSELVDKAEPRFVDLTLADLARLAHTDAQLVLREADRRDVVRSLSGVDPTLSDSILQHLSPRLQAWVRDDWEMEQGTITAEMIADSSRRVCEMMRGLAADGAITWPPAEAAAPSPEPTMDPSILEVAGRRVEELDTDAIVQILRALADWVAQNGWGTCEEFAAAARGFLGEGVRLAIDGTEPELVQDILETQEIPRMHRLRTTYALMIEAVMCIICDDNPRIVAYKLEVIYRDSGIASDAMDLPVQVIKSATTEALRSTLDTSRWMDLPYDEMKDFFVRSSILARREGIRAIAALAEHADDALLRLALGLLRDVKSGDLLPDQWLDRVERAVPPIIEDMSHRHRMVIDGLYAVQTGQPAEKVEEAIRGVLSVPMKEIRGARW